MSRTNLDDVYELTPMQQGMLYHHLYAPNEGFYVEQTVLSLTGSPDQEAFWRAWQLVVDRHPALRTAFRWDGIAKPVQAVHARAALPRETHDWRTLSAAEQRRLLEELLRDERRRGFDLETPPIMRVGLCLLADDRFQIALRLSHLVVDGWSIGLMMSDFTAAYKAYVRGREPVLLAPGRFRDYVAWWKRQDPEAVGPFWRRYLAGYQPAPLRLDGGAAPADGPAFDWVDRSLGDLADELRGYSQRHRLSLHTLVQGAWTLVLGRATGSTDVAVGTTFAHRPADLPGAESVVGCLVGTVPVRSTLGPERQVVPWLRAIQDDIIAVRDNAATGLADIQRWSSAPAGTELFDSIVGFQNMPLPPFTLGEEGLGLEGFQLHTRPHTPLVLMVLPGDDLPLHLIYDRRRVDGARAPALVAGVHDVLAAIVRDEPARLGDIPEAAAPARPSTDRAADPAPAPVTPAPAAGTETEAALSALFADLLQLEHVGRDDNLVELGLHSLLGTRAANRIHDEWRTLLPLQALFAGPTVARLAALIEAGGVADDRARDPRGHVDVLREAVLDDDITGREPVRWAAEPRRVLLTGATGYLGSALLERLLRDTPATVVCLVRSLDPADGRRRVREALAAAGRWDDAFDARIEVLPGNLSQPRLGLAPDTFGALADDLDEIYHLGAVVNILPPYRRVRPTNVGGTREVLRLATSGSAGTVPVHYVSPAEVTDLADVEWAGREVFVDTPPPHLYNGYIQSQWVADRIVGEAAARGVPVVLTRAARLIGSPVTGRWKVGDVVSDIVRGCVALGLVPDSDIALPVSTVEHVAAGMAALARRRDALGQAFHLTAAAPFTFAELAGALSDRGYQAVGVPLEQWYAELVRLSRRDPDGRWDLVLSVLGPWVRANADGWREPLYDTSRAHAVLGDDVPAPEVGRAFIGQCLDYFAAIGHVPAPSATADAEPVRG
ncbi:thioester reductase domain-containing protein [Micromonospora sp. NPDC049175]|uniref:thioester reductase domain-containing protein n=1 Tax=Micromonospora sp. NPDC049175 TaxID=3364266 RepID=UPI0037221813